MATQKPLVQLIPSIVDHFNRYADYIEANRRIYEILEGQLFAEVDKSLRAEMISDNAYRRARERIPPINVMKKTTDKLSKVYIEKPIRRSDNTTDNDIVHNITRQSSFDSKMAVANRFLNAQRMFAIEPYVHNGLQSFRVLGGHQFLPYSDDPTDPSNMTVFIKLLGNELQKPSPKFDKNGNEISNDDEIRQVTILGLYSDDEFLIVDTGGAIRRDKMREMGLNIDNQAQTYPNKFKRIPYLYGNKSSTELIPFPNKEALDISILIPKLFADLNYAAQFMSHSIIWFKNANLSGQEINPDAMVDLGERTEENGDPEMGIITPSVDIPNVIGMIQSQLSMYLSSIGIKATSDGAVTPGREASGVAKAIEEGDTTAERKTQVEFFRDVETQLWDLISDMQNIWVNNNVLSSKADKRKFSAVFSDTFTIMFAEMKPLKTTRQHIEEIQLLRDQKLITKKRALKIIYPQLSDSQVDEWLEELKEEGEAEFENMMNFGDTMGASRSADGTFLEGNQEATRQDPDEAANRRENS